jgi:histidinol-phosphatase (PHP family)
MMSLYDGHVHSPYCPHGSKDALRDYVEQAIKLGFDGLTFTEHAPLPQSFIDPTPKRDSGMDMALLESYIQRINDLKNEYNKECKIRTGLEVDFIEGYEKETTDFLNQYGGMLDDSILSVHFLKASDGRYHCMDYSPDAFGELVSIEGSIESVYDLYVKALHKSISTDLGANKPSRVGHMTLVMKFQKKFPNPKLQRSAFLSVLDSIAEQSMQLDYNGSGIGKPLCGEVYPADWVVEEALLRNIPLVYGSDAHQAKELGRGLDALKKDAPLSTPF